MTEETLPLAALLAKAGDGDFLRSAAEAVVQSLMETDVDGLIGAGRHERTSDHATYRKGYRDRTLETRLGALQLCIPKLRQGSYFPPFLEPRRTSEKALVAVIQEAGWAAFPLVGSMTWCKRWGCRKSTVSKLCKGWQRCRVHWMRNGLAYVPRGQQSMVAAALRQAFIEPDRASAAQTSRHVADQLRPKWPKLTAFIEDSEAEVLAHMDFPVQHRSKVQSKNPLERLNKEVKRPAEVVGIFPNESSRIRLIGRRASRSQRRMAAAAPLHADRAHVRAHTAAHRDAQPTTIATVAA